MKKTLLSASVLSLVAGAAIAQPAEYVDLGVLTGDMSWFGSFDAGGHAWFRFVITQDITGDLYLDFTTNGSTNPDGSGADTELGLYAADGAFLLTDDDDGLSVLSTLSFGAGSGLLLGDAHNLGGNGLAEGEDGVLSAGVYYLVIGEYNTAFSDGFGVSGGDEGVDFVLSIHTNVPAPGAGAVLAIAGLTAARRRR